MDPRHAMSGAGTCPVPATTSEEAARLDQTGGPDTFCAALVRLAAEIGRLRGDLDRVEHAMIALAGPGITASQMRELQTLDRLVQTVGDLAAFAGALARAAPAGHPPPPHEDLAAGLKLEASRERLLGSDPAATSDADEIDWL